MHVVFNIKYTDVNYINQIKNLKKEIIIYISTTKSQFCLKFKHFGVDF